MDKLPNGWKKCSIADTCMIRPQKTETKGLGNIDVSFIPMATVKEHQMFFNSDESRRIVEVYSGYTYFRDNDVLLAKVTPCFENGKSAIARNLINGIGFGSSEFYVLRPKREVIPEWIYYVISSNDFLLQGKNNMSGAVGLKRVTQEFLNNYKISLPPLPEQTRIVKKLDSLFERIDKSITLLEENIKHTEALMTSVLDKVFEQAETKWQFFKLKAVTVKIGSGSTPRGGQAAYKDSGISLIRSMNVYDSKFTHKGLAFIDDFQADRLSNVQVEKSDVLLNITGASVARCCIVDESILPARVNQHVAIIRPISKLDSTFLQSYLVSPKTKSALLFNSGGGATREAITKAMIENLSVPIPELSDQQTIVVKIAEINKLLSNICSEQKSKLSYLKALKYSLLDKAFKGEL